MIMKKKIFMLLALFAGVLSASADDVITVSSALIPEGKSGTFGIELTNTGGYAGFQVDLTLPTGVTFVSVAKTSRIPDDWTFSDNYDSEHPSSTIRIVGHYNKNANPIITGNSGNFLIVTVSLEGSSAKAGDLLPCSLTNMEVTPTGTTTAQKVADFNFNIEVSDKIILDESSTVLPAKQDGVDVLVKRDIKAGQWSTICLPFDMTEAQVKSAFGSDVELVEFDDYEATGASITIKFTAAEVYKGVLLSSNTPYLVKTSAAITDFTVDGVDVDPNEEDAYAANNSKLSKATGVFWGTLKAGNIIPADNLFISDNKFYYSKGSTVIKGFRGYFWIDDFKSSSSSPEIVIDINGNTTSIDEVRGLFEDGAFYDMKGMKIENPTKKGVYIQNGKKVVIK